MIFGNEIRATRPIRFPNTMVFQNREAWRCAEQPTTWTNEFQRWCPKDAWHSKMGTFIANCFIGTLYVGRETVNGIQHGGLAFSHRLPICSSLLGVGVGGHGANWKLRFKKSRILSEAFQISNLEFMSRKMNSEKELFVAFVVGCKISSWVSLCESARWCVSQKWVGRSL